MAVPVSYYMDIQYFVLYMTLRTRYKIVILIVIEVDMDNYTILQLISNHFTETLFFIYEIND